jgi:DNA replication protein DnaC
MDTQLLKENLVEDLETLKLHTMANICVSRAEEAAEKGISYIEFLADLVSEERQHQNEKRIERMRKAAKLPYHKTLNQFDFSAQPSIDEKRIRQLSMLAFIEEHTTVSFLGPPGVGKTHLSVSLALLAIEAGYSTLFTTWSDFAETIRLAIAKNRLSKALSVYTRPRLLVIDEIGYLPVDKQTATHFFNVVSRRYERGAMILTSNKRYIDWGDIFGDQALASAILDRLLHHSVTIAINGDSYRLKEKRLAGLVEPRHQG